MDADPATPLPLLSVSIFRTALRAFTRAAECNIWDERRRASTPTQPTQLAALFPSVNFPVTGSSIVNQFPSGSSWARSNKKI